ncbi:MAG: SDR family NAD(P)-dependent oxidoreductase, partial [Candidatus Sericytochromatia bacterium]|nr:SDR family NAD(P)-dependent oxidoreductase [Candidatus Tanganyikabacteria bacterium]
MQGAVALVTGASGGIGRAVALDLAQAGADIALHYYKGGARAGKLASEIRALGRKAVRAAADLAAPALPDDFLTGIEQKLGPVTHLVYIAGIAHQDMAVYLAMDYWDEVLAVNLRGAVMICQAVLEPMIKARQGSIVLVGSEASHGSPGLAAYAASKAGLVGFARSLAAGWPIPLYLPCEPDWVADP